MRVGKFYVDILLYLSSFMYLYFVLDKKLEVFAYCTVHKSVTVIITRNIVPLQKNAASLQS
jgi:hypothetical protein